MPGRKNYHRARRTGFPEKRRGRVRKSSYEKPRIDPHLKPVFARIGIPEPSPFRPDPFQLEALEKIRESDVLVSAPTGAGKTWIASQSISRYLAKGQKSWYASPLKALSNSIYQEFCREFGSRYCGILTGDRKENPDAPIIVGTTEILRNQLYDAMHEGTRIGADLVILDEAHYLSDPERGVVWEEVLIYLPERVRLLLLSATISNAEEIASWLKENRGTRTRVVRSHERPVPLETLFLFPDGLISPLAGEKGLLPRVKKFIGTRDRKGGRRGSRKSAFGEIIHILREFNLLPAIFFLKSRTDCDAALGTCFSAEKPPGVRGRFKDEVTAFLRQYPHLQKYRQMDSLLHSMVGSHHAGQLPYWKVLIEKMMNKGYLDAIFSTSTVAAGVNFPARTVVLVQSDKYDGHEFKDLTATDLHQMTGRAGRRGKDNIGFALIIPGLYQDPQLIYELKDSPPEPIMSQIHINFSMTLNLLLSHRPAEVKDLLERSFAAYQERTSDDSLSKRWDEMVTILRRAIPSGKCDTGDPYEVLENIQKRVEIGKDMRQLAREIRDRSILNAYREYLKRGRLFLHKNRHIYVVFHTAVEKGRLICSACNIERAIPARGKRLRLKRVDVRQIKALFNHRLDIPEDYSLGRLKDLFDGVKQRELETLRVEPLTEGSGTERLELVERRLMELPCEECEHFTDCHTRKNRQLQKVLKDLRHLAFQMEETKGGLWLSFKRHLRFLKETLFVDDEDHLTRDGYWASKLRLDHPLIIAEAIRKGGFHGASPEVLAGCIAPFVWDREQDLEVTTRSGVDLAPLEEEFYKILENIADIRRRMVQRGFENPQVYFWPAAALFLWAKGVPWEQLISMIRVDDGDMASLIVRTADHLRQVTNLKDTHPNLADTAGTAIELILREPVFIE